MFKKLRSIRFRHSEQGQGLVEYALILVMVALVVIIVLPLLGGAIGNVFSDIMCVLGQGGAECADSPVCTSETISITGTCSGTTLNLTPSSSCPGASVSLSNNSISNGCDGSGNQIKFGTVSATSTHPDGSTHNHTVVY